MTSACVACVNSVRTGLIPVRETESCKLEALKCYTRKGAKASVYDDIPDSENRGKCAVPDATHNGHNCHNCHNCGTAHAPVQSPFFIRASPLTGAPAPEDSVPAGATAGTTAAAPARTRLSWGVQPSTASNTKKPIT